MGVLNIIIMTLGMLLLYFFSFAIILWAVLDILFFEGKIKKLIKDYLGGHNFFFYFFLPYVILFYVFCFLLDNYKF